MKAIVFADPILPLTNISSLCQIELPKPKPEPHDLLVKIAAVAVNPVDNKIYNGKKLNIPHILGWDACGMVESVGSEVTLFRPGDWVYYAGSIERQGCYAEYGIVDERIVGHKPKSLTAVQAAALPLTSITAWELLFDRLAVVKDDTAGRSILIIGAAGGVGSILIQLARQLTKLRVLATASRPETQQWVSQLGAHVIIDHKKQFSQQLAVLGIQYVDYVVSLTHSDNYYQQALDILIPEGKFALIDDPKSLDIMAMKRKSISLHWEFVFTRPIFQTKDMIKQHQLLQCVAELIDQGKLKTTISKEIGKISAENLRLAHQMIASGKVWGKLVLAGF